MIAQQPSRDDLLLVALAALVGVAGLTLASTLAADESLARLGGLVEAIVVLVLAVAAGAAGARLRPWLPGVLALLAFLMLLVASPEPLSDSPLGGPLGYRNADADLSVLVALTLLVPAPRLAPAWRACTLATAGVVAAYTIPAGSRAGVGTALLGLALALGVTASSGAGMRRSVLTVAGLSVVLGAALAPASVALDVSPPGVDERRLSLWHDASALIAQAPWLGHGAGSFPALSPTARADSDTREAHAEVLQVAVEGGVPAAVLATVAALALVAALAWCGAPGAVAAVAVGVAFLQAGLDYVWHFPVLLAALGLAVGTALTLGGLTGRAGPPPARLWGTRR